MRASRRGSRATEADEAAEAAEAEASSPGLPGGEGGGEGGGDFAAAPQAAGGPAEAGGDAAAARAEEEPRGALAAVSGTLLAFFTSLFPGVLPEQPNGPFAQPQPAGGF